MVKNEIFINKLSLLSSNNSFNLKEERDKMNKKILLLGLVVLGIVMCTSLVSAYTQYPYTPRPYESLSCVGCGRMPYVPLTSNYYQRYNPTMPIRIGGFFGANSNYIIGLRPGTYQGYPCIQRSAFYYQPCNVGNNYGGYGGYGYNSYGYGGYGGSTGSNYMYRGPM